MALTFREKLLNIACFEDGGGIEDMNSVDEDGEKYSLTEACFDLPGLV